MTVSKYIVSFTEDSKLESNNPSNENMDFDRDPSACNQLTQTDEFVDLSKKPSEVEAVAEEGAFNSSQNETDV